MLLSEIDEETLFRNPILQGPPPDYSALALGLSVALVRALGVKPCPSLPGTLRSLLEASTAVRGPHRGDVLGRQVADKLRASGLLLDYGIARSVTRKTVEGLP